MACLLVIQNDIQAVWHVNTAGLAMPVSRAAGLGPNPKIEPFMDRLGTKKMCVTAKHFRRSFL